MYRIPPRASLGRDDRGDGCSGGQRDDLVGTGTGAREGKSMRFAWYLFAKCLVARTISGINTCCFVPEIAILRLSGTKRGFFIPKIATVQSSQPTTFLSFMEHIPVISSERSESRNLVHITNIHYIQALT